MIGDVLGSATFHLTLLQYRAADKCCEKPEAGVCGDCEPQFEICITQNATGLQFCQKTPEMNQTSQVVQHGTVAVNFKDVSPNSASLTVDALKGNLDITVNVEDYINESLSLPMGIVRHITKPGIDPNRFVIFGEDQFQIKIVVTTSLECDDYYYGQLCDVFCQNSTGYYCSENGTRECLPGFSAPDCDQITSAPRTSTVPPTLDTTTESKSTVTVVTSQASSTASTSRVSALSPATTEGSSTTSSSTTSKITSTPPVYVSSLATTEEPSPPSTTSSTAASTMTSTSQTTTYISQCPVCYTCSEMGHLIYCDAVEQCKPNEVCFVSKYFRSGHPVYHSGCLPKEICTVQAYLSTNLTNECVECCTDDFCNNKGCGDDAYQDPSVRGPLCLDCRHVSDPAECRTVALCQRHQLCSIEEFQWGEGKKYNLGCASPLCLSLTQSDELSRRSLPTCHSCCADDHCNRNCVTGSPGSVQGGVLVG